MGGDDYLEIGEDFEKIILPSERLEKVANNHKKVKTHRKSSKKKFKWWGIIIFLILIYLFYNQIILYFLNILKANPTIYLYFLYVQNQITNNTLQGFFFVSVLGSLFFLLLPSEALFIYYLSNTHYFFGLLILIMALGNTTGMILNYLFGRLLGKRIIKFLFGAEKYETYQEKINNYGGYVLFFGNIFPGPIELVAVFYGSFRFNLPRYAYLTFMGRLIKFTLLFLIFHFLWDYVMIEYQSIINHMLILKNLYAKNITG